MNPDPLGRTVNIFTAYNGHIEIVRLLAEDNMDVNQKNMEGQTALMLAANGSFTETVEFLVKNGADANVQGSIQR